jgi:hypothetical protein
MLLQTVFCPENLFTRSTIMVTVIVMIFQFGEVVEMLFAILAIWVARALNPMFFQPGPSCKVPGTIPALVVT